MNDYNGDDPEVRKEALRALWTNFQRDPELWKRCTDPKRPEQARRAAWEALKAAGAFKDDPDGIDDVEVRMYQAPDRPNRDKLVTIAFPQNFNPDSFRLGDVWLCSWNLWSSTKNE
jgi:hypothetical protein